MTVNVLSTLFVLTNLKLIISLKDRCFSYAHFSDEVTYSAQVHSAHKWVLNGIDLGAQDLNSTP